MSGAGAAKAAFTSIFAAASRPAAAAAAASRLADAVVVMRSTANNIHACASTLDGAVVSAASGGLLGYKHRARASPVAARDIGEAVARRAAEAGHRVAHLRLKGPSRGRAQMLRGLLAGGLRVADIRDVTPIPMPGTRPRKMRRL